MPLIAGKKTYKILTTSDAPLWKETMQSLPEEFQDVYFFPEYYRLYERPNSRGECFVYRQGDKLVVYPYLKTEIGMKAGFYDIEGAYGYNGLAANTREEEFLRQFTEEFFRHCQGNGIIAEFTRFNPVLENHELSRYLEQANVNKNVVVDLEQGCDDLWMNSYEHSVRKNVKKARRNHLQVEMWRAEQLPEHRLEEFLDIYHKTMDKNAAQEVYYFDREYFSQICRTLNKHALFFFVLSGQRAVSCELILMGKKIAYSFLGGTLMEFYPSGANNLLKYEIILKLKELKLSRYCLGGGQQIDDGIFRYKRNFSKNGIVNFYIGKKIHSPEVYREVCDAWEKRSPTKAEQFKNYFLKYKC